MGPFAREPVGAGDAGLPLGKAMSVINIQDSFLTAALHGNKHVTVYLLCGVKLSGRVQSFDKYSLVLETSTLEHLVYKHSISAVLICRNRKCTECFPVRSETLVPALESAN